MKDIITHRKTNRQVAGKRALKPPTAEVRGELSIQYAMNVRRANAMTDEHLTMCTALSRCIAVRPCVDTCIKVRASVSERDDPLPSSVEQPTIVMHHTDIRT